MTIVTKSIVDKKDEKVSEVLITDSVYNSKIIVYIRRRLFLIYS